MGHATVWGMPLDPSVNAGRSGEVSPTFATQRGFWQFERGDLQISLEFEGLLLIFVLVQTYPLFGPAGRLIRWVPLSYGEGFFALSSSIQEREGSLLLVDRREGKGGWR